MSDRTFLVNVFSLEDRSARCPAEAAWMDARNEIDKLSFGGRNISIEIGSGERVMACGALEVYDTIVLEQYPNETERVNPVAAEVSEDVAKKAWMDTLECLEEQVPQHQEVIENVRDVAQTLGWVDDE